MKRLLPVLIACLTAATALAEEPLRRFEVTPFASYRIGGSFEDKDSGASYDLKDDGGYGLVLNMVDRANTQWELGWSRQPTAIKYLDAQGGPATLDLDIDYYQIGGTYLWDGELAQPYLVATMGASRFVPDAPEYSSETYFAFSIGGGWKVWPTRRVGLRLEGRFYGSLLNSASRIFCSSTPSGSGCLINSGGTVLWQWEMMAGGVFRF